MRSAGQRWAVAVRKVRVQSERGVREGSGEVGPGLGNELDWFSKALFALFLS